eukprot:3426537-Pleurochrysis_carterae.AAC.1
MHLPRKSQKPARTHVPRTHLQTHLRFTACAIHRDGIPGPLNGHASHKLTSDSTAATAASTTASERGRYL